MKSKTNNIVFKILQIVAWIIFVGLCIEAGSLLVNFLFTIYKPEMVSNLYETLDLTAVYQKSQWTFFSIYSFILVIAVLKAYLFYIVVSMMHKMDLEKPFSDFVTRKITQISYYTLSIGFLSFIAYGVVDRLLRRGLPLENVAEFWADREAFIVMGAIIYIIAVIFKKGVEIQHENELTV